MTTITQPAIDTNIDLASLISPYYDDKDDEAHRTHIINPPMNTHIGEPGMSASDIVFIARLNGYQVVALCGYRWVPKRNPEKYPVCEDCLAKAKGILGG